MTHKAMPPIYHAPMDYNEFLKSKIKISEDFGFKVEMGEINPKLKPHNKLMVKWLVEGGKRACFASFGLHKTVHSWRP